MSIGIFSFFVYNDSMLEQLSFYQLAWYFFVYSTLGWLWEVAFEAVKEKRFINRGFLLGPWCPIYGLGMVLVLWLTLPFRENWWLFFLISATIVSVVEYFTSLVLEKVFHHRWWDYSQAKFNLDGRIALPVALAWGAMITLTVKLIQPQIDKLIMIIPTKTGWIALTALTIIMVVDAIFSIMTNYNVYSLLKKQINSKHYNIMKFFKKIHLDLEL